MSPLDRTPRSTNPEDLDRFQDQFTSSLIDEIFSLKEHAEPLAGAVSAKVPIDEALPILEELADHPDPDFRGCALDVLAKIAPERAEAVALRFLEDPDGWLRHAGLYFLAERGYRDLMPLAARLLAGDLDEYVRSFAAFCLGMIGDESVLPVLRMAVEHDTGANHEGTPIGYTADMSIRMIDDRLSGRGNRNYLPSWGFMRVDTSQLGLHAGGHDSRGTGTP